MITNTSVAEFKRFCRDTGMCLWDDLTLFVYIRRYGFIMGIGLDVPTVCDEGTSVRLLDCVSYIAVESPSKEVRDRGASHAIFWDGEKVYDPDPAAKDPEITDYKILHVFPIVKLKDEEICVCECCKGKK